MKKILAIIALFTAVQAFAADNVPTNYFAGYKYVSPSLATNTVTDLGLATNVAYVCIPVTTLTDLTTGQASASTGDVRAVVYGFNQAFYATRAASTNATQTTAVRGVGYDGSDPTNVLEKTTHNVTTTRKIGTATLP
jgi:hypothetical protein